MYIIGSKNVSGYKESINKYKNYYFGNDSFSLYTEKNIFPFPFTLNGI